MRTSSETIVSRPSHTGSSGGAVRVPIVPGGGFGLVLIGGLRFAHGAAGRPLHRLACTLRGARQLQRHAVVVLFLEVFGHAAEVEQEEVLLLVLPAVATRTCTAACRVL